MKALSKRVSFTLRVDPELLEEFREAARKSGRTDLNSWLIYRGITGLASQSKWEKRHKRTKAATWPSGWPRDAVCPIHKTADHDPGASEVDPLPCTGFVYDDYKDSLPEMRRLYKKLYGSSPADNE